MSSCSSEKPADVKPEKLSGERVTDGSTTTVPASPADAQYSMTIMPEDAYRNSILNIRTIGFAIPDGKVEWLINNKPSAKNAGSLQFKSEEIKKEDTVQAKAIVKGKEILSNIIKIKNSPPVIGTVKVIPEVFKPGDMLGVDVTATDADGDEVAIQYEWTKNGEPAGDGKQLGVPVKREDKISVKITPFDGESYGRSGTFSSEVKNLPPVMSENKKVDFDGKVYSYKVMATDPDGDTLAYSLKKAPAGMTIDTTGLIKWNVPLDFVGKESITVSVTDGQGGEALQNFTCEITNSK